MKKSVRTVTYLGVLLLLFIIAVETVTPDSLYPESNWLIGNHSDELTPWIPIMSLKSSIETNFFVLPCCPYDLNGKKFIRINSSVSQYTDYMNYIQKICTLFQFKSAADRLRIPSTKRTCIIGIQNSVNFSKREAILKNVDEFIKEKCSSSAPAVRPVTEKVRNCTQIDRNVVDDIINEIVIILLRTENFIDKGHGKRWNKGGKAHLGDLSKVITRDLLKQLKDECGGLQTLLRNHRYIFEVVNGVVSLREPLVSSDETRKYKNKSCWFLKSHPDGCLYDSEKCAYKH